MYDLEGPESNREKQKSSYQFPTLKPSVKMGALKTEGSGRVVTLEWIAIPNVEKYAIYRDSVLISKQEELIYIDSLEWGKSINLVLTLLIR